ncbi:unnamed protein product [Allacma fusca]|uniref:Uncharacterized protein n=1 Tax=Allacma fusca TaxID=39272 RepID=A0A8J2NZ33_9HEXA|nr:unnamed protein product [Allacma fusca]
MSVSRCSGFLSSVLSNPRYRSFSKLSSGQVVGVEDRVIKRESLCLLTISFSLIITEVVLQLHQLMSIPASLHVRFKNTVVKRFIRLGFTGPN